MKTQISDNLRIFGEALETILQCKENANRHPSNRSFIASIATMSYNIFETSLAYSHLKGEDIHVKYQPMMELLKGMIGDIYSSSNSNSHSDSEVAFAA